MQIKKAVIPAAGLGTRFLPFTKSLPKEMLPIIDRPCIDFLVREIVDCGIEDILIILSRGKESIVDYFDSNYELEEKLALNNKTEDLKKIKDLKEMANIHFIRQHEALGLGHAVNCAASFVGNESFLLLLGDELIVNEKNASQQLIEKYNQVGGSIIGLYEVDKKDVNKYGIVKMKGDKIISMVEKPEIEEAPSNLAIIGRYIIGPEIFKILPNLKKGAKNEIQLTDGLIKLMESDSIYGLPIKGERYDLGSKLGYLKANFDFALKDEGLKDDFFNYVKGKIF
ncbi:UTP--glucose-1-phosphate uridylyltransferase GalU [Peptoniphilus catoniae]|uniref:UTP--glucose-1-phosphate uridylyltransferase GalU n=1 Tax=Peptoniphilus catoniae TaxID=1660341 RepID=UPI0010FE3D3C|nr:UTP--glucose-1-phosphate uridylyltransferase GalU [Peptoniphilus catoniae]